MEGTGAAGYGQSVGIRFIIFLERYTKSFQAEIRGVIKKYGECLNKKNLLH